MDYIETEDERIQADFARRVGQVLLHYEVGMANARPQHFYEATFVAAAESLTQVPTFECPSTIALKPLPEFGFQNGRWAIFDRRHGLISGRQKQSFHFATPTICIRRPS